MKYGYTYICLAFLLGVILSGCKNVADSDMLSEITNTDQLVFCGRLDGDERTDIFLLSLANREWANLTEEYVFNIDDGFGHSIGCDDAMNPYGAAWSPAGNLLIVDAGLPYLQLPYILEISGNGEVQTIVRQWPGVWSTSDIYDHPTGYSWSPKGDKVAFDALNGSDGYSNLFIGDVSEWETSNPDTPLVQMTEEYRDYPGVVYAPSWSPDGEKIAVSLAGPASGIIILSNDGSQSIYVSDETSEQLSNVEVCLIFPLVCDYWADFPSIKPSWSPDGSEIIFLAATTPKDRTALFKVDANGQNLTLLIPEGVHNPIFSPDGQHIAYIEYAGKLNPKTVGRIILVDTDGKNRQVLATVKTEGVKSIFTKYYVRDLSWSPDGKWLVFTSNVSGKFQLYLVSADGSTFEQIMDFPGDAVYPQWRPGRKP